MSEALCFFFLWREQNRLFFDATVEQNAPRYEWGDGQNCRSLTFVVVAAGGGFSQIGRLRRTNAGGKNTTRKVLLLLSCSLFWGEDAIFLWPHPSFFPLVRPRIGRRARGSSCCARFRGGT